MKEEKFSKSLPDFRAGVRKGEITIQDVDTKIKILNAQFKKGDISKAKYDKDIKFISEEIMPLLPDDIPGEETGTGEGKSLDSNTDRGFFAPGFGERREDSSTSKTGPGAPKNDSVSSEFIGEDMINLVKNKQAEDANIAEAQEAENELTEIELERVFEEEKFSKPLSTFKAGVEKGEITIQDVDLKIKILSEQYKKGNISKAKYDKDIKFISEEIMPLLPDDIPGAQNSDDIAGVQELDEVMIPGTVKSATDPDVPVSSFVENEAGKGNEGQTSKQSPRNSILSIVSENEAGKGDEGYKAIFGSPTGPKTYKDGGPPLTERTIKEVLEFQRETINVGVFNEKRAWEAITEQRPFDKYTGTKEFWDEKIKKAGLTQEQIEDREFMLGEEGRMRNMKPFSSASGKYQFMKDTIEGLLESGAIKEGDVFNKETQDKMALALIGEKNIKKFLDGKMSTKDFAKKLAKIWASVPNEKNESEYKNISGNKALSKFEDLIAKLEKTKKMDGKLAARNAVLTKQFSNSKGSLSFPLAGGKGSSTVTRGYGVVKHETLPGIKLQSSGLRFKVEEGSIAASVSKGEVSAIQVNSNGSYTVLVKHGEYTTVYTPVVRLSVKPGQDIAKGQSLGEVLTKKKKTELQFQVWKGIKSQDPTKWLS